MKGSDDRSAVGRHLLQEELAARGGDGSFQSRTLLMPCPCPPRCLLDKRVEGDLSFSKHKASLPVASTNHKPTIRCQSQRTKGVTMLIGSLESFELWHWGLKVLQVISAGASCMETQASEKSQERTAKTEWCPVSTARAARDSLLLPRRTAVLHSPEMFSLLFRESG